MRRPRAAPTPPLPESALGLARLVQHMRTSAMMVDALLMQLDDALSAALEVEPFRGRIALSILDARTRTLAARRGAQPILLRPVKQRGLKGALEVPPLWIRADRRNVLCSIVADHVQLVRTRRLREWPEMHVPVVAWYDGAMSFHRFPEGERLVRIDRIAIEMSHVPRRRPSLSSVAKLPGLRKFTDTIDRLEHSLGGGKRRRGPPSDGFSRLVGGAPFLQMRRGVLRGFAEGIGYESIARRLDDQIHEVDLVMQEVSDFLRLDPAIRAWTEALDAAQKRPAKKRR